jgi:D-alanine-D-alanine ligase
MTLKVGLTYNLRKQVDTENDVPEDFFAEYDDEETINAIADALTKGGCKVTKIEADEKAYGRLSRLLPDIIFNFAEGLRGESRESHIPAMLEMLDIPYTGSGPLTLAIALNKALTHQLLEINGISSPFFQVFNRVDEEIDVKLEFPCVVKPLSEGSSKGIWNSSLIRDEKALKGQVSWVIKTYNQPAIVEEFLPGREFTIGLIGNETPTVLPVVEILLDKLPVKASKLYSYEAKWIWDVPENPLEMFHCPADITEELREELEKIAVKTFRVLNCKDVCRIDMRLDKSNEPQVLEVNPIPGLIPDPDAHSCLPEAARTAGYSYDQLICTILWHGLKRHGLEHLFEKRSLIKLH